MEKMNALTLIITLVVGVILTGALLGPVIKETTTTEDTITNEGYVRMTHHDATDTVEFSWSYEAPNTVVVNDVPIEINVKTVPPGAISIIGDTDWLVRMVIGSGGEVTQLNYLTTGGSILRATVAESATVSMTMAEGNMSGTFGSTTLNPKEYADLYVADLEGEYIMKDSGTAAYIHKDSQVVALGMTTIGSSYLGLELIGDYENGITPRIWRGSGSYTVDTPIMNVQADTSHVETYKLESITLNATNTSTEEVTPITYSYFLVPYEITSERAQHLDSGEISLMNAIPIMVIVALLMVAIGAIAYRRAD